MPSNRKPTHPSLRRMWDLLEIMEDDFRREYQEIVGLDPDTAHVMTEIVLSTPRTAIKRLESTYKNPPPDGQNIIGLAMAGKIS